MMPYRTFCQEVLGSWIEIRTLMRASRPMRLWRPYNLLLPCSWPQEYSFGKYCWYLFNRWFLYVKSFIII